MKFFYLFLMILFFIKLMYFNIVHINEIQIFTLKNILNISIKTILKFLRKRINLLAQILVHIEARSFNRLFIYRVLKHLKKIL